MVNSSIWKDTYYETTGNTIQFALSNNNNVVYNGKAYAKPNTGEIKVNISNICENYLDSNLGDLTGLSGGTSYNTDTYKEFVLTLYNEVTDTWSTGDTYGFLMNYDREYEPDFSSMGTINLNEPINQHYVSGQIIGSSSYSSTTLNISDSDAGYCGQYALLYENSRGGWDSFLFEGKCKKSDNYNISKYRKNVDNKTTGFSSTRYMNIITPRWELSTGFLSDSESALFAKHLVSTNKCYLQDLVSGDIIPVNIVDTQVNYKKYNDGNRPEPVEYTITVEASQEYRRK